MTKPDDFYTHAGLDYPDPPHDPNPDRFYGPETLARMAATMRYQKALLALWGWMRGDRKHTDAV